MQKVYDTFCIRLFALQTSQIVGIANQGQHNKHFLDIKVCGMENHMNEKSLEVLKQYDFEVRRVSRGRGGMLLYTENDCKLFLECNRQEKFYEREADMTQLVKAHGFSNVDTYVLTTQGEVFATDTDGRRFVVKNWYDGRECNVMDMGDVCEAVATLAKLHLVFQKVSADMVQNLSYQQLCACEKTSVKFSETEKDFFQNYQKHTRELKLTGNYLKNKHKKSEFEQVASTTIQQFYEEAAQAVALLSDKKLLQRFENARQSYELSHGGYNYHNILFTGKTVAVTNFEKYKNECQISDLYQFMRKILEKSDWNIPVAYQLLDAYDKVKPIAAVDLQLLGAMFSFPEKYWKIINSYFNANKAWIPPKTMEKLKKAVAQNHKRQDFIHTLCG